MNHRKMRHFSNAGSLALSAESDWISQSCDEEFERLSKEITMSNGLSDENQEELWVPRELDWESDD